MFQIAQLIVSIRARDKHPDLSGDPWNGRTLEWSTASPPPIYNFAIMPDVQGEEAYWTMKQKARKDYADGNHPPPLAYEAIKMPYNSPVGFVTAFFAAVIGFALIWHIWWMAILGMSSALMTFLMFAWRDKQEYEISAEELITIAGARHEQAQSP
jgi:cytochrome o ubiquinol oxidase subunit 1